MGENDPLVARIASLETEDRSTSKTVAALRTEVADMRREIQALREDFARARGGISVLTWLGMFIAVSGALNAAALFLGVFPHNRNP